MSADESPSSGSADGSPPSGGNGSGSDAGVVDRAATAADSDVSEWLSLEPDEEVVWVGEPTKMQMVGTVVTGVVLIPFLIGVLILLFAPLSYLGIKHTDYVVTTRSLYVKRGVLSTNIESVDLDRIQNTEFTQSFWGTRLGFGTIEISTAGSSGADISFSNVEDAREVREEISRVQREFGGGRGGRDGTGGDGPARDREAAGSDQVAELVAELRATREALERVEARLAEGTDASPHAADDHGADPGEGPQSVRDGPLADETDEQGSNWVDEN